MVVTTASPSAAPEAGSRHSRSPSRPHGGAGFRVRGQSVRAGPVPCFWESIRLRSLSRWPTLILGACLSIASQLGASRQLPSQLPTHLERRVRSRRKRAFVCPEPPLRRFAHSGGSAEIRARPPTATCPHSGATSPVRDPPGAKVTLVARHFLLLGCRSEAQSN